MRSRYKKSEASPGDADLAASPEATGEDLLQLAYRFPVRVAKNAAVLDLLSLENPNLWHRIVARCREAQASRQITSGVKALSIPGRRELKYRVAVRGGVSNPEHVLKKSFRDEWLKPDSVVRGLAESAHNGSYKAVARRHGRGFLFHNDSFFQGKTVELAVALAEEREWQLGQIRELLAAEGKEL